MSEKVLFVASIARDIRRYVDVVKKSFTELKCKSKVPVHYVIYENDSQDDSDKLLLEWSANDKHIHVLTEKIPLDAMKARDTLNQPCKYEMCALARNNLLAFLRKVEEMHDLKADHVVMLDMNNHNAWPCDAILECLMLQQDFDMLVSNGIRSDGSICDPFSFRDDSLSFGQEVMGDIYQDSEIQKRVHKKSFLNSSILMPITSGYNGLAIIKRVALDHVTYSAFPSFELNQYYRNTCDRLLIECHPCINEKHVGMFLFKDKTIFYHNYRDFNYPIVSPHVTFCMSLIAHGYNRIFLCPQLEWKWYIDTFFIL